MPGADFCFTLRILYLLTSTVMRSFHSAAPAFRRARPPDRSGLSKWPHETILFVGAAFFSRLDNQRRAVVDGQRLDEVDDVTLNVVVDKGRIVASRFTSAG